MLYILSKLIKFLKARNWALALLCRFPFKLSSTYTFSDKSHIATVSCQSTNSSCCSSMSTVHCAKPSGQAANQRYIHRHTADGSIVVTLSHKRCMQQKGRLQRIYQRYYHTNKIDTVKHADYAIKHYLQPPDKNMAFF